MPLTLTVCAAQSRLPCCSDNSHTLRTVHYIVLCDQEMVCCSMMSTWLSWKTLKSLCQGAMMHHPTLASSTRQTIFSF